MYPIFQMENKAEKTALTYAEEDIRSLDKTMFMYRRKARPPLYPALEKGERYIWGLQKAEPRIGIELETSFQRPSFEEDKRLRAKISEIFLPYERMEKKVLEPWSTVMYWKVEPKARAPYTPMLPTRHEPLSWPVTSGELRRRLRQYWGPKIASFLERVVVRL